ncbi:MAG: agmatine deiminase family protein [Myxococcota bacterium]
MVALLGAGCVATDPAPSGELPTYPAGAMLRVPAEWEPQEAIWLQWPRAAERSYEPALARVVATIVRYEDVHVLVHDASTRRSALAALTEIGGLDADVATGAASPEGFTITWHDVPNDNAWMRDNGPRYVLVDGALRLQNWAFDAWGGGFGRVPFRQDDAVPNAVGEILGLPVDPVGVVHERGDLEFNGEDAVLLNWSVIGDPARNPGMTRERAIQAMQTSFGVERVVLLEGVPMGDATRGHVDGIARFVDADTVVVADCSQGSHCAPGGPDDRVYDDAAARIAAAGFEVVRFPFLAAVPYRDAVFDTDYMNWLVGNGFVITVGFGHAEADRDAEARLREWFPGRDVYVIEMLESWYAGGGVHCHTNDQPRWP